MLLTLISKFEIFLFLLYNRRVLVMTGTLVINPEFSFYSWGNGDAEQSGDSAKAMQFFLKKNSFIFYLFIHSFIHLLMVVLGLRFCARAFSSCGKRGPLFIAVRGPLTIVASLVVEHRLQSRRRSSCGSRAQLLRGMWALPRPGLEPVFPELAGRLSTTAPPGKPDHAIFYEQN